MNARALSKFLIAVLLLAGMPVEAANLYTNGNWPALATDRTAHRVGDILTILVYESSAATNTANNNSDRKSNFGGDISAGVKFNESANLDLRSGSNNAGTTNRSGAMVAQIGAVVDQVLPNGDLQISGAELLNINGEKTKIRVKGRVRLADITAQNTVLSSRLADAVIVYNGEGFVSSSAKPGIVTRIFDWLGII